MNMILLYRCLDIEVRLISVNRYRHFKMINNSFQENIFSKSKMHTSCHVNIKIYYARKQSFKFLTCVMN